MSFNGQPTLYNGHPRMSHAPTTPLCPVFSANTRPAPLPGDPVGDKERWRSFCLFSAETSSLALVVWPPTVKTKTKRGTWRTVWQLILGRHTSHHNNVSPERLDGENIALLWQEKQQRKQIEANVQANITCAGEGIPEKPLVNDHRYSRSASHFLSKGSPMEPQSRVCVVSTGSVQGWGGGGGVGFLQPRCILRSPEP